VNGFRVTFYQKNHTNIKQNNLNQRIMLSRGAAALRMHARQAGISQILSQSRGELVSGARGGGHAKRTFRTSRWNQCATNPGAGPSASPGAGPTQAAAPKAPKGPRGPVSYTSLGLTAIVGACLMAYYQIEKENRREARSGKVVEQSGKPALGGPWVLVDQDGIPRTDASYMGQYVILYFGFTHCPDICPSELVKIGKILDTLGRVVVSEFSTMWGVNCCVAVCREGQDQGEACVH
jgi:hypothetical protein